MLFDLIIITDVATFRTMTINDRSDFQPMILILSFLFIFKYILFENH